MSQSKALSVPLEAVVGPAVSCLELAALLAQGAWHAAAVHDKVVAWFGLRCGAAVRKVRGKAQM